MAGFEVTGDIKIAIRRTQTQSATSGKAGGL
jgi:hypothetical protein